ncbi:hypothetical protein NM688_g7385 [Phlebia brevispora]|uniref:Uncharacterized protein n=1 Tax=Phlebia brevispora TaxID=194682 RepID=A0ACC1S5U1_9APHY|nr:hypothetical protein NM688_g7385 [Phlebia brevispora]
MSRDRTPRARPGDLQGNEGRVGSILELPLTRANRRENTQPQVMSSMALLGNGEFSCSRGTIEIAGPEELFLLSELEVVEEHQKPGRPRGPGPGSVPVPSFYKATTKRPANMNLWTRDNLAIRVVDLAGRHADSFHSILCGADMPLCLKNQTRYRMHWPGYQPKDYALCVEGKTIFDLAKEVCRIAYDYFQNRVLDHSTIYKYSQWAIEHDLYPVHTGIRKDQIWLDDFAYCINDGCFISQFWVTYPPLPKQVIAIKQRRAHNAQYAVALDAYQQEQAKRTSPNAGEPKSLSKIAQEYGVDKSTLSRLAKGGVSMSAFNATKQLLSPEEERVLVDHILESAARAMPPTHGEIAHLVNAILAAPGRHSDDTELRQCGQNWVDRFLLRHHDELQTHWSRPLDTIRAKSLNTTTVNHWYYDILEKCYVDEGFLPENTYGMDESGFPRGPARVQRVVGLRGAKVQHRQGTANRENVTVMVTICADGTVLRPLIIFKAADLQAEWRERNVAKASFAWSDSGWTNSDIAAHWLIDDFDLQTREKAAGKPRALFVDGHNSHYSKAILDYARSLNITIFGYPPHCTHALQGLDVVCFACMKEEFAAEVERFEIENGRGVNKEDFAFVFGTAFLRAFTEDTIRSAWRKTGIVPFDPSVIQPSQMKPAQPTSIHESFTLSLPSPVRAVASALYDTPPTAQELNLDTYHAYTPPHEPVTPTRHHNDVEDQSEASTSRKRPTCMPIEDTPRKRRRLVVAALAQTKSGAILINKEPFTSETSIPNSVLAPVSPHRPRRVPPISECPTTLSAALSLIKSQQETIAAQERALAEKSAAIRAQNAQLLIQDLRLKRAVSSLRVQERKKKKKTKLFPEGKGRVLTDDSFREVVQKAEDERLQEEADKATRAAERMEKKGLQALLDAEWIRIKAEHVAAVAAWDAECKRMRAAGVLVKNLPKKPKRPRKPTELPLEAPEDELMNEDESIDEDTDEDSDEIYEDDEEDDNDDESSTASAESDMD